MAGERMRSSQRGPAPSHRSSQRSSHGTSSSSSRDSHIQCKNCCRKLVMFMCTQVGVGGLLVLYALIGSAAFMSIEGRSERHLANETSRIHKATVQHLWNHTLRLNVLEPRLWKVNVNETLLRFQEDLVRLIKQGYDGKETEEVWSFPASLMFCLSVFTMIGYGHMTPKTDYGKVATILYAILGIPLYILYFMNMGKVFAKTFKFVYRTMHRCVHRNARLSGAEDDDDDDVEDDVWEEPPIIVPSTACIWVMIFYMAGGTIMFAEWEQWSYLNSCYFSFTSLAKIGIGDYVPGIGNTGTEKDTNTKLIINFMYLLIGMGLIAMCYTLMKEEIVLKVTAFKQDLKDKCFFCGIRLGFYPEHPPTPRVVHMRAKSIRRSIRK